MGVSGVVVFASQKGGSGKTTLSGHLAVEAERAGDGPVTLIDTDPQGSLSKWWNARAAPSPSFAKIAVKDLAQGIADLKRQGVKLIVIDTPPAVTEAIAHVVAHADLVVVPTRPSPHDLRAVGPTVDIVERFRKPLVFVVNSATARARITSETAVALSQHGVVAPVTLHHRVDYAASMIDGRTVQEVRENSRSADEVESLWRYISGRLARLEGRPAPLADFETAALTPAIATELLDGDMESDEELEGADAFESDLAIPAPPRAPVEKRPVMMGVRAEPAPVAPPAPTVIPGFLQTRSAPPQPRPDPGPVHIPPSLLRQAALAQPAAPPAPPPAAPVQTAPAWDGVDRRSVDRGPPMGVIDRRRVTVFGRRLPSFR